MSARLSVHGSTTQYQTSSVLSRRNKREDDVGCGLDVTPPSARGIVERMKEI